MGFAPMHGGFADHSVTASPLRPIAPVFHTKQMTAWEAVISLQSLLFKLG